MYKIKQLPEDFIVREINNLTTDKNGEYYYFLLKKKNYNTADSIKIISRKLKINEKNIGFSGNKDKNAVTEQIISIKNANSKIIEKIEDLNLDGLSVVHVGNGNDGLFLGSHQGNEFFITVRNLNKKELDKIKEFERKKIKMPNYFGQQRFSDNNYLIGKEIINKNFNKAIDLILETNSDNNEDIYDHLKKHKNDFVGALKKVPFKLLKFYIHSYQSYLFNNTLEQYLKKNNLKIKNEKFPIIGFGTEINNKEIKKIIKKLMEKEKITFRDFIINSIPDLSQEGDERDLFIEVEGFKIIKFGKDELNKNRFKVKINFSLQKGSYATVFVGNLFKY